MDAAQGLIDALDEVRDVFALAERWRDDRQFGRAELIAPIGCRDGGVHLIHLGFLRSVRFRRPCPDVRRIAAASPPICCLNVSIDGEHQVLPDPIRAGTGHPHHRYELNLARATSSEMHAIGRQLLIVNGFLR